MPRLPFNKFVPPARLHGLSDKELIAACLRGDKSGWDTLINRYVALIYSVSLRTGLSGADADDVVQDVCVILFDHLGDLRSDTKLASWLISTTRREAWRLQRRKGLKLASELGDEEWVLESGEGVNTQSTENPEDAFLAIEQQQMVRSSLENMPERCRRMLKMLYGVEEPPSYVDLAAELGIPVGSIGPTRARCLQQLRKILDEAGF